MIQDYVMSVCNILFVMGLLPQVIEGFRTKWTGVLWYTSLTTSVALMAVAWCVFSLGLWLSGIITSILAALWLMLFVQAIIYRRPRGEIF